MSYKRLGDYIQLVDNRNTDSKITLLRGVSTRKVLIESVANMTRVSLHNYKIVGHNQFVYVADTSRRAEKIGLALNDAEPCIVSSIYTTFEVKDKNELIPEYLFIWFNRSEFNRYARFNSWGSARETFNWEDMCDVRLPIPNIDEQKKYVALYKGLLKNQKVYESSLADLQLICDTYIEDLIKTEEPKLLGDYIEKTTNKNTDDSIKELIGISERKEFRVPSGKVNRNNLTNHLIVETNEFGYIPRMNTFKPLAVALSHFDYPVLISASYISFKVINPNDLLPEFLFLFFKRTEFDRYAYFNAWSSTRETFDWDNMCEVKLPIPDIKIQEAIVTIYHTLETRKKINNQLKDSIKPLCPVLMRGVVEEMKVEPLKAEAL
ncbi:MAG: restriction endonuclease subunit S [Flavobacteriaceae bacterium]